MSANKLPLTSWNGIFNVHGSPMMRSLFIEGPEVLIDLAEDCDGEYKAATLVVDCMLSRQYELARSMRQMMKTLWRFSECGFLLEVCLTALADRELALPEWKEKARVAVREKFKPRS